MHKWSAAPRLMRHEWMRLPLCSPHMAMHARRISTGGTADALQSTRHALQPCRWVGVQQRRHARAPAGYGPPCMCSS